MRKINSNSEQFLRESELYKRYIKRLLDFTLSLIALIVLLPILILVAILIRIRLGSPVLFTQQRPGKDEKIFRIYKYRTMTDERDEQGNLQPDEIRLTKFGKALRATSIDELPELINVIKGDMAIIGPRPLLVQYLPLYNEYQKRRHEVRPGLSGLAQISGRNQISWEEKFNLDVKYVDNISFLLDLKILFSTLFKVFKREGISAADNITMPEFLGNGLAANQIEAFSKEAAATKDEVFE